jgi:hypothetical protein
MPNKDRENKGILEAEPTSQAPHDEPSPDGQIDEGVDQTRKSIDEIEKLPEAREVFGVRIEFTENGKKAEFINRAELPILQVNVKKFPTRDDAVYAALKEATTLAERTELVREKDAELKELSENPKLLRRIIELRGLKRLVLWDAEQAMFLAEMMPTGLTYSQQFDYACEQYILTGQFPENLPKNTQEAIDGIPRNDDDKVPLSYIVEEQRVLSNAGNLYRRFVHPAKKSLLEIDKKLKETESDEYVPPPFGGEMEPMDPEKARFKVTPFCGGYYRGEVFRYNPETLRLEADSTDKETFNPVDLSENIDEMTQYTFEGVWPGSFFPGKEPIIPLPYNKEQNALPLPATLEPKDKFTIMRSRHGVFSLEPKGEIPDGTPFRFKFILSKTADNKINDEPLPEDTEKWRGTFDDKTRQDIENIGANVFLSQPDRARAVASTTRSRFIYPKDEQIPEMDSRYGIAGLQLLPSMDEHGLADCHWGNNHATIAGRELGIPWRVIHGYFISRHPDVEFAAVGGIGHEWSEIWDNSASDEEDNEWMKLDATAQKENDEEEENKEEEDLGDIEVEESGILELTEEEIDEIIRKTADIKPEEKDISQALFQKRTKIDAKVWSRVKKFIDAVNAIQIPTEDQIPEDAGIRMELKRRITAPHGTLQREWQKLFALICKHRTIEKRAFRGPVPRSEGDYIDDFVAATIGVLSGDPDPVDSKVIARRKKEVLDVTEWDEDVICDLTASTEETDEYGNVIKVEQKKLILSLLHNEMELNNALNDSRTRNNLREPVQIRSAVYSIRGSGRNDRGIWTLMKESKESITEQLLCQLADELNNTSPGSGDLRSALRAYKESITEEVKAKLQSGKFVKILTIYSDGNMYCKQCGHEGCKVEMHQEEIAATKKEIAELREMGVIVQGIGFTNKARAIKTICHDERYPHAAEVVDDVSKALVAQHKMRINHLKRL